MDTEERPVHAEYNCTTGEYGEVPLSDEEWDAHKQRMADAAAQLVEQQEEEERIRGLVENHPDPLVQILAKKAGLA
jgi:hypothetical protein